MRVYISHSTDDRELLGELVKQLEAEGFDVFRDDQDIEPGENWAAKVAKAIESSQAMIVLLTENAASSPWVQHDIQYALTSLRYKNRLITLVVDKSAKIPWILKELPLIPVRRKDMTEAAKRAAEELRGVPTS